MKLTAAKITNLLILAGLLFGSVIVSAEPSAVAQKVVQGNTAFALKLYARLAKNKGNLVFSPYSTSIALAMTYVGAAGRTAAQMKRVLHLDLDQARLHRAFGAVQRELLSGQRWVTQPRWRAGGWRLHMANALWPALDLSLLPGFLQVLEKNYNATPRPQDYKGNAEKARRIINQWVAQKTKDKIKDLLAPGIIRPSTRLVLTNAVYFKGTWVNRFSRHRTEPQTFHLTSDRTIQVPTMTQTEVFGYAETKQLQILEMDYRSRAMSLVVILPRRLDGLADLERALTPANLARWLSGLNWRRVSVFLPKFKTRARFSLRKTLAAMGMPLAFSNAADFSNMSRPGAPGGQRLKISEVVHQAFVDVNESGTEAAAATAVVMAPGAAAPGPPPPPPKVFRADHPFLFFIRDRRTGTVLFLGRVVDPRQ